MNKKLTENSAVITTKSTSASSDQESKTAKQGEQDAQTGTNGNKKPMPFTYSEIISRLKALLPASHHLITVKGSIILHFDDFNQDGISEFISLGVKSLEPVHTDALADFSTLFSDDKKAYPFYLYIFSVIDGIITLNTTTYLGKQLVYGGLSRIAISKNSAAPFIISVAFQKQEGTEQEWLVFKGSTPVDKEEDPFKPCAQLNLKDTPLNHILIKDIDKDGAIDIILQEHGEVEGIGNETYLTWLKWNGTTFNEFASTNVVYNLQQFLQEVKRLALEHAWHKLLNYAFQTTDVQRYKQKNYSDSAIIFKAFDFANIYKESTVPATVLTKIQDIIFPEILENPFLVQEEQGSSLNLSFRVENLDGTSHIGEITLYMSQNPFGKKQFFLALP